MQQRYKREFDRRIKKIKRSIREGDCVYIDLTDGISKTGKLESPGLGPFRVLKNDGQTVVIKRNEDVERINADRITYAPPPGNAPPREAFAPAGNDIEENSEGPTYVADNLLKHRVTSDGTLEFRVKWLLHRTDAGTPTEHPRGTHFAIVCTTPSYLEENVTDTAR